MGIDGRNDAVRAAVFLDRDGVLNDAVVRDGRPYPPRSLAEMHVCIGAAEATRRLQAAGFRTIVVTNQPDVGAGRQTREAVEQIHEALRDQLAIDDIRVCYHTDADDCACRKPRPGMLLHAAAAWSIDLTASFMVGDRWRDIEAGRAAGCRTVLLGSGYLDRAAEGFDAHAGSLLEATSWILEQRTAWNCRRT